MQTTLLTLFFLLNLQSNYWTATQDHERWKVKTLEDIRDPASLTDSAMTIAEQCRLTLEEGQWHEKLPRRKDERCIYTIHCRIDKAKEDRGDGDYHLRISDGQDTMNAEIPDSESCNSATHWKESFATARKFVDEHLGGPRKRALTENWSKHAPIRVVIRGVGFWDRQHGKNGNGRELHPVISITPAD